MFCSKCGEKLSDTNNKVCPNCGASLENPFAVGAQTSESFASAYDASSAPVIPGFGEAIKICFSKYASFRGRASRSEYWYFHLFVALVNWGLGIASSVASFCLVNELDGIESIGPTNPVSLVCDLIAVIFALAVAIPTLAVCVRRLHDIGRTGWWCLIGLVPMIGALVLFIFAVIPSKDGANEYGLQPVKRK